jgi:adenylyltransferase/sulfurtransferase
MPLTDAQIERYSRQIIVPHIGGRGQERLLAAKMILAGEPRDIEQPLAYLVGAGVGSIELANPLDDRSHLDRMRNSMSALNPDVTITPWSRRPVESADRFDVTIAPLVRRRVESSNRFDLAMLLLSTDASRDLAATLVSPLTADAFIFARLGDSPRLAILPDTASCPRCAHTSLLASHPPPPPPTSAASDTPASDPGLAQFIAMLATTEALKLLSGFVERPASVIIDFDGYATRSRRPPPTCTCSTGTR